MHPLWLSGSQKDTPPGGKKNTSSVTISQRILTCLDAFLLRDIKRVFPFSGGLSLLFIRCD